MSPLILRWSFWIKLRFNVARMAKIKTKTLDWDVMGGAFFGVTAEDYRRARAEVKRIGLDPGGIKHPRPPKRG